MSICNSPFLYFFFVKYFEIIEHAIHYEHRDRVSWSCLLGPSGSGLALQSVIIDVGSWVAAVLSLKILNSSGLAGPEITIRYK